MRASPSIFLYCHNVVGLGHIVRSIRIATALKAQAPAARIRIVTGCRAIRQLAWPDGIELVELPAVLDGNMASPSTIAALGRRHAILLETLAAAQPDISLVDTQPMGLNGELRGVLKAAVAQGWPTRRVLGVPYAYAGATTVRSARARAQSALAHYDAVVAYTDPDFHPVLDELPQDELPASRFYAGYVAEAPREPDPMLLSEPRMIVVLNGGGGRSTRFELVDQVLVPLAAAGRIRLRIVLGALHRETIDLSMTPGPNLELVHAMPAHQAVRGASVILSACGYGSAFSLLRLPQPIIFLPEVTVLGEQVDRARMLAPLDRVWAVRKDPAELRSALDQALVAPLGRRQLPFSLDGAAATARWLLETIAPGASR